MKAYRLVTLIACFAILLHAAARAADKGVVAYGAGNRFIIKTNQRHTLLEWSGRGAPKVKQAVRGVPHDVAYQQLYDRKGKELLVGFVPTSGTEEIAFHVFGTAQQRLVSIPSALPRNYTY